MKVDLIFTQTRRRIPPPVPTRALAPPTEVPGPRGGRKARGIIQSCLCNINIWKKKKKKRRFFDCCRLANNEAIITTSHLICSPNILNALAVIFLLHFSLGSTWCFTLLSLVFLESCVKVQTAVPWHTSDLTWSAFTLISNFPTCENEHRKQGMKNSDKHGSCAPIYSTNGAALRPSLKTDLIPRSSAPAKANGVRSNTSAAQEVPRYPLERPAPR